ncbi:hypothetical protein F01_200057 [Burkholderia cenocepacia]|nr:hypothetical protein F01_200057 [Burkholderia cenocepacia]
MHAAAPMLPAVRDSCVHRGRATGDGSRVRMDPAARRPRVARMTALVNGTPVMRRRRGDVPACGRGPGHRRGSMRRGARYPGLSLAEVESLVLRVRDAQRRCEQEGRQPQPFHEYSASLLMGVNVARQLSERRGAPAIARVRCRLHLRATTFSARQPGPIRA